MNYLMSHFDKLNAIMGTENILSYSEKKNAKDLGIHLKCYPQGVLNRDLHLWISLFIKLL